jgi:hypothetical protein
MLIIYLRRNRRLSAYNIFPVVVLFLPITMGSKCEELDGSAVSALRRAIAEAKQRSQRSVIGWVKKKLLSRAPPCFGRHVKPLVPAAFTVVSTHSSFKEG